VAIKANSPLGRQILALTGETPPKQGRGHLRRHETGRMNKLEERYAAHLDDQKVLGHVHAWWFERVKFRLGDKTWYTVDFLVQYASGLLACHEVKGGFSAAEGRVKFKVAADQLPLFEFVWVTRKKGEWVEERL